MSINILQRINVNTQVFKKNSLLFLICGYEISKIVGVRNTEIHSKVRFHILLYHSKMRVPMRNELVHRKVR